MTAVLKKHAGLQGEGRGLTATAPLAVGKVKYMKFMLSCKAGSVAASTSTIAEVIERIQIVINGVVVHRYSAQELMDLNIHRGVPDVTGVLSIHLRDLTKQTIVGQDSLGWGMANVANATIEITYADVVAADNFKTQLYLEQVQTYNVNGGKGENLGYHQRIMSINGIEVQGSGKKSHLNILKGNYGLNLLMISTDQVSDIEVKANDAIVHQSNKVIREQHDRQNGFTPVSGRTIVNFDNERRLGNALPMNLNDFILDVDYTAANANVSILSVSEYTTLPA